MLSTIYSRKTILTRWSLLLLLRVTFIFFKIVMAINEWPEREGTMKAGGEALWVCKEGRIKLGPRGRM